MNPEMRPGRGQIAVHQLLLMSWLVLLWCLLWGSLSWLTLLSGVIIAFVVTRVFYLPAVQFSGRFNLWWALVFAVHFGWDVLRASVEVAWLALNTRRVPNSSIVAVSLRSSSDLIMTLVSIAISLVPGSLVVEADRLRGVLYVHVLDTATPEDVAVARADVEGVEHRIVMAMGSRRDVAAFDNFSRREGIR